jgi:diguanylate cyclase (GGDEF)-like protein
MNSFGPKTIRTRLLIGILAPVFLILAAGLSFESYDHRKHLIESLDSRANMLAQLTSAALSQPLWDFDLIQVEETLHDIAGLTHVGQAQVIAADGRVIASVTASDYLPIDGDILKTHQITYTLDEYTEVLGELHLTLPLADIQAPLFESTAHHLVISAVFFLLVSGSVFFVLTRISKPLTAISDAISDLQNGRLDCSIPYQNRNDEVGMLAQALEQMRRNEIEMAELRNQSTEAARRELHRIHRALKSTRDGVILTDETGIVVFSNANASIFFADARDGDKLNFRSWLPEDVAEQIEERVAANEDFAAEASVTHFNSGEELNLFVRGGPIRNEDGLYLGTLLLATDHSDQARQAARVKYMAEHDSLTGLPNRRLLEQTLASWLETGEQVSILLADLDHFKTINDTLGHPIGDALLKVVADKFSASTSTNALAARLGGDEFAIVVKGAASEERLSNIANSLVYDLSKPLTISGNVLHTGMSAGIATLGGKDARAADGIRCADLALYEAKKGGRGRVEVFHTDLETAIKRKALLERELRGALKEGGIRPVFQVQTDLRTGEIIGFETLARWHHRHLGSVSPAEFIPVAEECGLIRELTYQIMTQAFQAAARWHDMGFKGRVAVNLSPKLFGSQVDEFVNDCLYETGCPASAVEAEITETVVLSSGQSALREIEALQRLGVTVALDDFGMGYSSLSYLQKFPVNKIKVDAAFVSKLPESPETKAIVVAIAELGHALGMHVTGEGAETEEHRRLLQECKVDYLQGYFDGPPLAERAATARLFPGEGLHLQMSG